MSAMESEIPESTQQPPPPPQPQEQEESSAKHEAESTAFPTFDLDSITSVTTQLQDSLANMFNSPTAGETKEPGTGGSTVGEDDEQERGAPEGADSDANTVDGWWQEVASNLQMGADSMAAVFTLPDLGLDTKADNKAAVATGQDPESTIPSAEALHQMSIKQLRAVIRRGGLSDSDCFERPEIVSRALNATERLREAQALRTRLANEAKARESLVEGVHGDGTVVIKETICELECLIAKGQDGPPPDMVIFFFHGYQATAVALLPIAKVLAHSFRGKHNLHIILPQARDSGWWPINMTWYVYAMMGGEASKAAVLRDTPQGVYESRAKIKKFITEYTDTRIRPQAQTRGSLPKVVFMGFSQGAMLSLDMALYMQDYPVSGVVLVSGFLMAVETWAKGLAQRKGLKVFQTHGRNDPLVPFRCAEWLHDLLRVNGAQVTFFTHFGGHDIGPPEVIIGEVIKFLTAL